LDKLLADAAVVAGGSRESGSPSTNCSGTTTELSACAGERRRHVEKHARIVIGVNGAHSAVAKTVQAPRYNEHPALTYGYYSYFTDVPMAGIEVWIRPNRAYINFPTNNDLTCVAM
jgi:flavin-dependent dehydrogenase